MALIPRHPPVPCLIGAALLLATASLAHAQGAAGRSERPDPLDPQARVPAVGHASALAGYRPLGEDKRLSWKQANETVNRIGGWRSYAREAQQPEPAASAAAPRALPAPASSATPARGGAHRH